jgi:hypothetical protein
MEIVEKSGKFRRVNDLFFANLSCTPPRLYRRCYRNRRGGSSFDTCGRSVPPYKPCTCHLVWNSHLYSCDDMVNRTNHGCFQDILLKKYDFFVKFIAGNKMHLPKWLLYQHISFAMKCSCNMYCS